MNRWDKSTLQLLGSAAGFGLTFVLFALLGSGYLKTPGWLKTLDLTEPKSNNSPLLGSSAEPVSAYQKSDESVSTTVNMVADSIKTASGESKLKDEANRRQERLGVESGSDSLLIKDPPDVVAFGGSATIKERILLIGDSQCGGLRYPLYSYCYLNGHQLVASVTWYSSTTKHWAITDTLQHFMTKFQPTMVIVGLGLNEVFARDVEKRKKYVDIINQKIDSAGAKVFWMGPAAWVKDKGIVSAIRDVNGERFFDATTLSLSRGGDGRHPDMKAYKFWFAHAAAYMTKGGFVDFSITEPYKNPGRDTKSISLSTHRL